MRASRAPAPAAHRTSPASSPIPSKGAIQGSVSVLNQPAPIGVFRRALTNGSTISTSAMGGTARLIPLTAAPIPRCRAHQAAVLPRAAQDRAGPSASSSPGTPHSTRTATTDICRNSPNTAVSAASGTETP